MREIPIEPTFESWQSAARELLREGVGPADVAWREIPVGSRPSPATDDVAASATTRVPRAFVDLARGVAIHRDPSRWALLYEVLWRLTKEGRELMERGDPSVERLARLEAEVRENRAVLTAGPFVPSAASRPDDGRAALDALRTAAARCTGCDLSRHASQTVFGRGPADARVVFVGEQPGDQEDLKGAPFVGPAGEVFDRALAEVGLPRDTLYVTNAVKHFKFTPRGKRRIHQTPGPADIAACRPWIEAELELLHPEILVCLGATASRALIGPAFRLMQQRGLFLETRWAARTLATLHPSAVLRGEDEAAQARLYGMLRDDLRTVANAI